MVRSSNNQDFNLMAFWFVYSFVDCKKALVFRSTYFTYALHWRYGNSGMNSWKEFTL